MAKRQNDLIENGLFETIEKKLSHNLICNLKHIVIGYYTKN